MPTPYQTPIGSFTRKSTFFWAAVGATVGLANLWQFPYLASRHGGGLFVLIYLACLLLVTLPLMVTEASFGRYSRHGIVLAMDGFVRSAQVSRLWMLAGRLSILAAFLVLSFTAVFGAVALAYMFFGAFGRFTDAGTVGAAEILTGLVADPKQYRIFMGWHAVFLGLVVWVSVRGVVNGVERTLRVVVPAALLLMIALFSLAIWKGGLAGSIHQMLEMHPDDVTIDSVKAALFHAFFTLGLGMGVWSVFGAYTAPRTQLKRSILAAVLMDTLVGIMAGMMIFSVATGANRLDGEHGFGLLFISMPVALAQLPGSQFILTAVFLLVVLIVWTTSICLLEPVVGWFREWTGSPRGWSAFVVGLAAWFVGLASLLSFNVWSQERLAGATVFRWLELITGGLLIPVVAVLICVFTGWCLTRSLSHRILGKTPGLFAGIWYWVMRLVLPAVVAYIGILYTSFSLNSLCIDGNSAMWCQQDLPVVENSEPAAMDPGDEGMAVENQSDALAEQPGSNSDAATPLAPSANQGARDEEAVDELKDGENAPKQEDILYHSV
ncbi:sodium-dependent transporter [Marinobacter salinexigens]|uniref:Sodium-dependent transporter n=1 Tax=Marinobacter salinexigens TaxID=2919747 RepID=A0A5B0VPK6_9GAMM|nr:sodium-dependent transporter [Marinobacter salinexigens]KAA1175779.1 sodium-dependent transporter [Marinobacter salinexigens]